MVDVPVVVRVP